LVRGIKNYQHLTLIDEKQIYYVGYTRQANFTKIAEHFVKRVMSKFYEWFYSLDENNVDTSDVLEMIKIDDTDKLLSREFSYKYEVYKALHDVVNEDNDKIKEVINKYELQNVDIDRFVTEFEKVE